MLFSDAENRVAALEQMFSIYRDQPAELMERMKATAEAFEQLSDANARLEKYKRIYGDLSTLPPDVAHLTEQLRTKEAELERLRMSVTQQTEVFPACPSVHNTHKLTPSSQRNLYLLSWKNCPQHGKL